MLVLIPFNELPVRLRGIPIVKKRTIVIGGRRVVVFRADELVGLCEQAGIDRAVFRAVMVKDDKAYPAEVSMELDKRFHQPICSVTVRKTSIEA